MKSCSKYCLGLTLGLLLSGSTALGQSQRLERPTTERPPFDTVVNALGMERGVPRTQRSINTSFFVAEGKMLVGQEGAPPALRQVTKVIVSLSYHLPAIRTDAEWNSGGVTTRVIEVARDGLAWNEAEPGIGATSTADLPAARLRQVWLTPHGALRAMVEARSVDKNAVDVTTSAQGTVLTMDFQGAPLRIEADENHRPKRLVWSRQDGEVVVQYFDYKDWEILDVFFPKRIVQTVGGQLTFDLEVSDYRTNPYVVFPVPKQFGDE